MEHCLDTSYSYQMIDGIWAKQMHFHKAGAYMIGQTHSYNHLTLLAKGKMRVTVNDVVTEYTAPFMILIHKDHKHDLVALEDDTVAYCIHAVRDEDGNIIDKNSIPAGVDVNEFEEK